MPTIVPTLSVSRGYLQSDSDKAAYLLTFFIYNPGGVSDYYEQYNGSLRNLVYANPDDPYGLAAAVSTSLSNIFSRNFPGRNINIDVTPKDIDGYKYGLVFNIMSGPLNTSGQYKPIILSGTIQVDDDYRITLKYRG